jgi:hypothetical protein
MLPALALDARLPDGTILPLRGDVTVTDGFVEVDQPGGNGRALLDALVGPLEAHGWVAAPGALPPAGVRPGASEHAVSATFQRGEDRLRLDLFDAGFGVGAHAALGTVGRGDPSLAASWVVTVPGGPSLPFASPTVSLDGGKLCVGHADPAALVGGFTTALAAGGWKQTPDGWLARGSARLTVAQTAAAKVCLQVSIVPSPGWVALGVPLAHAFVSDERQEHLGLRFPSAAAIAPWRAALATQLERTGWVRTPLADGREAWVRGRDRLYVQWGATETGTGFVNLGITPQSVLPGPVVRVVLPGGAALPLIGNVRTVSASALAAWQTDAGVGEGEQLLLAPVQAALVAGGWEAEPVEPGERVAFHQGGHRLRLEPHSGSEGMQSTLEVRVDLDARAGRTRRGPDPAVDPAAPPPFEGPFSLLVDVPGATIPVTAARVDGTDTSVCVGGTDATRAVWEAQLQRGGWKPEGAIGGHPAWWARGERKAWVHPRLDAPDDLCLFLDAEIARFWTDVVPIGPGFVANGDDRELDVFFATAAASDTARAQATDALLRAGWEIRSEPTRTQEDAVAFWEQAFSSGDQQITLTQAIGPETISLAFVRRGPGVPW